MDQPEKFPSNENWEIIGIYNVGSYHASVQKYSHYDSDYEKIPVIPIPEKAQGIIRVVCISDTHSETKKYPAEIPDGDILIHGGDFSYTGKVSEVVNFDTFLASLPHEHKIVIAGSDRINAIHIVGNHDITFHPEFYQENWQRFHQKQMEKFEIAKSKLTHCTYLEDQLVIVNNLHIYGTPWQPEFCDWAFNLKRGKPCAEKWEQIPDGVDILISHGPPYGHGDETLTGMKVGCNDLLQEVRKKKPLLHIFGHVHEGYGVTQEEHTVFINASTCNLRYKPFNLAVVVDLKRKGNNNQQQNTANNNNTQEQSSEDGFVFEH